MKQLVIAELGSRTVHPLRYLLTLWQKNLRPTHHVAEISKDATFRITNLGQTVAAAVEVAGAVMVPAMPVEEEPTQNTDRKAGRQTRTAGTMHTSVINKVQGL